MLRASLLALLFAAAVALEGQPSPTASTPPKTPTDWFRRADAITDIRTPGSAPFHLQVVFHALPGVDFAAPGQSDILTGDGAYEETWLSPEKWRREITLGAYHAIEVRSGGVRKLQATSDYEPSRVLMLLDALLEPVPRYLVSPELESAHPQWKLQHMVLPGSSLVRLSYTRNSPKLPASASWDFSSNGTPLRSANAGLLTSWQQDTTFAGHSVPRVIVVTTFGTTLLSATLRIDPPAHVDSSAFRIPGAAADPGATLRPLLYSDVTPPRIIPSAQSVHTLAVTAVTGRVIVDRQGIPREAEILGPVLPVVGKEWETAVRSQPFHPATIDGVPCEFVATFLPPLPHW
jgi:hypothetical protein